MVAEQVRALARRVRAYGIKSDLFNLGYDYDRKADALKELLALSAPAPEPEPKPDPAFTASLKRRPARRKRQTEPKGERGWDAPIDRTPI